MSRAVSWRTTLAHSAGKGSVMPSCAVARSDLHAKSQRKHRECKSLLRWRTVLGADFDQFLIACQRGQHHLHLKQGELAASAYTRSRAEWYRALHNYRPPGTPCLFVGCPRP